MQDLGTLGGNTSFVNWINDAGDIAGKADLPGPSPQNHDAVLWKDGVITDLGTLPGDSCATRITVNSRESGRRHIGGSSVSCSIPTGEHAFLWEHGGPMVDLNTLIRPGSSLQLVFAFAINERGEIAGTGLPPGCTPQSIDTCGHAFVLIPCAEDDEGCGDKAEDDGAIQSGPVPPTRSLTTNPTPEYAIASLRARMVHRYRIPGLEAGPRN